MTKHQVDVQEKEMSFALSAIRVAQPIGEFYIASISHKQLYEISYFDVRRMLKDRDVEEYLGIQRPLSPSRVDELQQYVRTVDACFPTSIVLAVDGKCAVFDEQSGKLTLSNFLGDEERAPILYREIAKVLDGQHLRRYRA
jgi:DGQHR domain-containing protein